MDHIVDFFFPPVCTSCRSRVYRGASESVCQACRNTLRPLSEEKECVCCGDHLPYHGGEFCENCLKGAPNYHMARSLFAHEGAIKTLLHRFKFENDFAALSSIESLVPQLENEFDYCDYIIPVPLHPAKLRSRGFNQSLLLAKMFFSTKSRKIRPDLLKRVRNTISQTGLSGEERRHNLGGAFGVENSHSLAGTTIFLVDDVFTTGTTVNECSLVLMACGVKIVKVLTLTRSVAHFS